MVSEARKRANKKYDQSEKGKATKACYIRSKEGKATNVRYQQSEKGKIKDARYRQTKKGKAVHTRAEVRYNQTEKGKIREARVRARRKRELGYNPINEWFLGCHGHHINEVNVLFIPEELHRSIKHSQDDPKSMKAINDVAFEWFHNKGII